MKTSSLVLCGALFGFAFAIHARAMDAPAADRAADLLARTGSVPVSTVGSRVEAGTFRVQVSAQLGRPDVSLPDGTWLYRQRRVTGSEATGTLVVRFNGNRVHDLALVSPVVAAALCEPQVKPAAPQLLATK